MPLMPAMRPLKRRSSVAAEADEDAAEQGKEERASVGVSCWRVRRGASYRARAGRDGGAACAGAPNSTCAVLEEDEGAHHHEEHRERALEPGLRHVRVTPGADQDSGAASAVKPPSSAQGTCTWPT